MTTAYFTSPIGNVAVTGNSDYVSEISIVNKMSAQPTHIPHAVASCIAQLKEYFAGKRYSFDVALDENGTDFQKQVWRTISEIGYGHTATYTDIAESIHKPRAQRAVGTSCGKNRFLIVVPCHRVVATHGLGGYAGGLDIKEHLLQFEKSYARRSITTA